MSKRLLGLAIFLFALFSLLMAKFYQIQIVEGKTWEQVAKKQHFFMVQQTFKRGVFWSNTDILQTHVQKPVPFVWDIQKYHLFIDPMSIPEELKSQVANNLGIPDLMTDLSRKTRNRKIAMWLDRQTREKINLFWLPFAKKHKLPRNALYFVKDYQRSYPFGTLLGQVLHTVQSQKDEKTLQAFPTGGLELSLNGFLKGRLGKRLLKRSPRHAFETGEVLEEPQDGSDVFLTINHVIQAICEKELEKGVQTSGAKAGWAVMMEPFTGEILALAQYPFFDPADYKTYFNDPERIDQTKLKAITDANEPGSIIKPLTLCCALAANQTLASHKLPPIFDPDQMMPTSNGFFPGRKKEVRDVRLHKFLDMRMALQKSSNVYMARLMQRVCDKFGPGYYRTILQKGFGLGEKTGVELYGESPGVLPTPGKIHPNGTLEWSMAAPYSLAMGYNLQTNSLQMVRAFAVLANGGYLVKPTLVRKIVDQQGSVVVDQTEKKFPKVFDESITEPVVQAMRYVMKPGGSGFRAEVAGYTCAGKTGTINKLVGGLYSQKHHVASFIGFMPLEKPAFVLLVAMDEPDCSKRAHYGSVTCAPVFREISRKTLAYLGVPPDDPAAQAWKGEAKTLQEKYEKWNKL